MNRTTQFWAVAGVGGLLVLSALGVPRSPGQQVIGGQPYQGAAPVPNELNPLAGRLAEEVRHLGDDVAAELGATPRGRQLQEETRELGQAVNEFRETLRNRGDRFQARQAYAGIDATWHNLMGQLSQPGGSTPAVDRAAQRVGEVDARIHRELGLNEQPRGYYGAAQAPTGMAEVQRLSHALVDRADYLASVVRADMVGPGGGRAVQDAVNLAQTADTFHDALHLEGRPDATLRNGFAGVAGMSDRLEADFRQAPPTPRVQSAYQAYHAAEVLLRQTLGLPNDPGDLAGTALAPPPQQGPPPVVALADQLAQQATAFAQVFSQTAGAVPEGGRFLADAQALQAAADNFRQDAARGLNPGQLAFEFRDVDAVWQRLARRTNRIARGRTGPNIQQVGKMGLTVAEIHRLLGIPGYAPVVAPIP